MPETTYTSRGGLNLIQPVETVKPYQPLVEGILSRSCQDLNRKSNSLDPAFHVQQVGYRAVVYE
jgi:hypothetical protein